LTLTSKIILASSSERRLSLLSQIGIKPEYVLRHNFNEEISFNNRNFKDIAKKKALSVIDKKVCKNKYVIAADTLVYRAGKVYEKTNEEKKIKIYLSELSGKKHFVYGSICIISPKKKIITRLVTTEVFLKRISKEELNDQRILRDGISKAGGYAVQSYGALLVKKIKGSYTNIVGLSLYDTKNMLSGLGWKKSSND
tara:strand:- start:78 stop:668 length:591 start_codon:yes stop_codon:yes gene_type:complete